MKSELDWTVADTQMNTATVSLLILLKIREKCGYLMRQEWWIIVQQPPGASRGRLCTFKAEAGPIVVKAPVQSGFLISFKLPPPPASFSWSHKHVSRVYFKLITDNLHKISWWTWMSVAARHPTPLQTFTRMRMMFTSAPTGIMGYTKRC